MTSGLIYDLARTISSNDFFTKCGNSYEGITEHSFYKIENASLTGRQKCDIHKI